MAQDVVLPGERLSSDPAELLGYPATFPIELALRVASTKTICEAYDISREEWERLRNDPVFQADLRRADDMVRKEGMSFKLKAQLQADELLKTSWRMIHSQDGNVPASVKADLLKFTIRAAGLVEDKGQGAVGAGNNLQINISLG